MKLSKQAQLVAQRIYQRTKALNRTVRNGCSQEVTYAECESRHIYFQAPFVRDLVHARIIGESGTGVYLLPGLCNLTPLEFLERIR